MMSGGLQQRTSSNVMMAQERDRLDAEEAAAKAAAAAAEAAKKSKSKARPITPVLVSHSAANGARRDAAHTVDRMLMLLQAHQMCLD